MRNSNFVYPTKSEGFEAITVEGTGINAGNAVTIAAKKEYSRLEFSAAGNYNAGGTLQTAAVGDDVVIEGSFNGTSWFVLGTLKFDTAKHFNTPIKTKHIRMTAAGFSNTDTWNVAIAYVD